MHRRLPRLTDLGRFSNPLRQAITPPQPPMPPEDDTEAEETRQALRVLNLSMAITELLLSCGTSAHDAANTALRVTRAYGLRGVHCDVTYTSIHLAWQRLDREPLSTLRVIRPRGTDYSKVESLHELVTTIESGELTVAQAHGRFRRIEHRRQPYRPWVVTTSNGGVVVGLGMLFGARPIMLAVTFVVACLIDVTTQFLGRRGVPVFFCKAVGAAIPTCATLFVHWAQAHSLGLFDDVRPTFIVSACIVLLLAGMSVVGAAQDSIDGYYVTASARVFEVLLLTIGIVTGILLVLRIGHVIGMTVWVYPDVPRFGEVPQQLIGAMIISVAFAIACHATWRVVLLAGGLGLGTWTVQLLMTQAGFGPVGASATSATVAAMLGVSLGIRLQLPQLALVTCAIVPLMPGSMVFRGVLLLTGHTGMAPDPDLAVDGMMTLLGAAGVGLALAAGSSLGTYLARPMTRVLWRRGLRVR